jgi:glycosyltransferase involved in cell wall biosynthesis
VVVYEVSLARNERYSDAYPALNEPLTASTALYEGLRRVLAEHTCDVIDVPLWAAQGFVTAQYTNVPLVVWLQTTRAQLARINAQSLSRDDQALIALEQNTLGRAGGVLADSHSVLDAVRADYRLAGSLPVGVAYLGLPQLAGAALGPRAGAGVEALVVGRLEKRKGTPQLLAILPDILRRHPQLTVRFVGRDNSANDDWRQRHKTDYAGFFRQAHPELAERVIFEGYVGEARLSECYRQCDLLLSGAVYESFGLIFLEAMRAARPVVAFAAGGAAEIFARGADDGALLAAPGDAAAFAQAIERLASDADLRARIGAAGLARFRAAFTDTLMAEATLHFYECVIEPRRPARARARRVYQVMEALDVGDAVSDITRRNTAILKTLGQPGAILARYTHPSLQGEIRPIHTALAEPDCAIIFHYWGYNTSAWLLRQLRGPKAVHYHNITPPDHFTPDSPRHQQMTHGYAQLREIADCFDLVIGDSEYNVREFAQYLRAPRPLLTLYPTLEPTELNDAPFDQALLKRIRQSQPVNILFVGRIVRNKRQDRLIELFDYYAREINRHAQLWLVGNDRADPAYRAELERLRTRLASGERVHFTGKVSDAQLHAYFRAADVLVCASEHEGFCVPIAQAMAFDVPVLAFAAAAVPETMGGSGLLIHEWDTARVGELMHLAISDQRLRERIVAGQRANLRRFSAEETHKKLRAVVAFLQDGTLSPLFSRPDARTIEEAEADAALASV